MKQPSVSVVIPALNAAKYLSLAIESIKAQNHQNLEILVVDDASQDNTVEVARAYGVQVFQLTHQSGAAVARNHGIAQAQGELIAFLDADDEWLPNKLTKQIQLLLTYPHLQGITGYMQLYQQQNQVYLEKIIGFIPSFGTALLRREIFTRVGICNPDFYMCDDLDWFNRAREHSEVLALMPEVVLLYRQHENNITNDQQKVQYWIARVFQERLRRFGHHPPALTEIPILEADHEITN